MQKGKDNYKITGYQISVMMGDKVVHRSSGGYAPPISVDQVIDHAHGALNSIRAELDND